MSEEINKLKARVFDLERVIESCNREIQALYNKIRGLEQAPVNPQPEKKKSKKKKG